MGWREVVEEHRLAEDATSPQWWSGFFQDNPDVLYRVLGDLYQATTGSREAPDTLAELWSILTPTFSQEPFGPAVKGLLGARSLRWLAMRTGFTTAEISRWVNEKRPVVLLHDVEGSMRRLEVIAKALAVHPSHFSEWRRLWAMSLIDVAFQSQPNLSISFFRKFSRLELAGGNGR